MQSAGGRRCRKATAPTEAAAETIMTYFKVFEFNLTKRCARNTPRGQAVRRRPIGMCYKCHWGASKMGAQPVGRDLFSGSLIFSFAGFPSGTLASPRACFIRNAGYFFVLRTLLLFLRTCFFEYLQVFCGAARPTPPAAFLKKSYTKNFQLCALVFIFAPTYCKAR